MGVAREAPLPPTVLAELRSQRIPESALSVYAEDLATGEVLLARNAEVMRQPASTIKVLTTFAALDMLGPAYTWRTRVYATGTLRNGVLDGDLVIVGGGDPYLVSERWWSLVNQVRQAGVKTINGDIVLDRSYFAPLPDDRAAFDGAPERSYNVIPDALLVNFQTARLTLTGEVEGSRPVLVIDPMPSNLQLNNQVTLRGKNCRRGYQGLRFSTPQGANSNGLTLSGTAAAGCSALSVTRAIMTAPEFAYGTFRTYFEQLGGQIKGQLRLANLPGSARLLTSFESLSMGEVVRLVNKYSNNIMARTLLLTLGAEKLGTPASVEKGQAVLRDWLTTQGINADAFVIDNGSGLSRIERASALGFGQLLRAGWKSQFMPEFAASLPLAATDGTLRARFQSPAMRGRMRLKTGHLEGVASLAGYVNAASGKHYAVATIVNYPGAQLGSGDAVEASVLRWIFTQ